jgi:D-aspartate ligase
MKQNLPYVVIIDIDHINGLQTARLFAERAIPVIGIANDLKNYPAKTRVCKKIFQADTKSEELVEKLISISIIFDKKPLLIPSQDNSVLIVSRNRKRLEQYYKIALPAEDVVEMLMDKPSFYKFALNENLPVAKYFLIRNKEEAEAALDKLNFPCIIKPPMRYPSWDANTKIKAYKVYDRNEFWNIYQMCANWVDVIMAQEWIEGTDVDLYSCNCYFNNNNEPLVSFVAKKLRQYPPVTGNTSLGIECKADEVRDITLDLFKRVNYHGLGYVELKRDVITGKYYIIEPNIGRPTGRSAIAEAGGVELLYTMYCDKMNFPLPEEREQRYTGVKWIHLRADLMSSFYYWKKGELTFKDWLSSMRGKKYYAVFSLRDPLPFISEIAIAFKVTFNSLLTKLTDRKKTIAPDHSGSKETTINIKA